MKRIMQQVARQKSTILPIWILAIQKIFLRITVLGKALMDKDNQVRKQIEIGSYRAMATAEYAVGILAAVALALLLLKVFQDPAFMAEFSKFIQKILGKAARMQ